MLAAAGGSPDAIIHAHQALFGAGCRRCWDPGGNAFLNLPAKISAKRPNQMPKLSGAACGRGLGPVEDFLLEYLDGKPLAQVGWGPRYPR